jgi:Ca2+-dependent lipid-binding protein
MPSLVKIRIERGRDLPVMDRNTVSESSTDAFVEIRLDQQLQRTATCKKTLDPVWNEEFRFEVTVTYRCID